MGTEGPADCDGAGCAVRVAKGGKGWHVVTSFRASSCRIAASVEPLPVLP